MLGFAQKAGKLTSGEQGCEANLKRGKAKLLILSEDATDGTKKKFINTCTHYKTPFRIFGNKNKLGIAVGKSPRSTIVIEDVDFAKGILKLLGEEADS